MSNNTALDSKEGIDKEAKYKKLIIALSIIIPLAVALLFGIKIEGYNFNFLPPIYAATNGLTAILLIVAVQAIKKKKVTLHMKLIKVCMLLSASFLIMYIAYHITSDSTVYGDLNHNGYLDHVERDIVGASRYVYLFILATHIILSVGIIPLVLFSYARGISNNIEKHRKLAKITFPLWWYVSVTGVVIYFLISPYYIN